MLFSLLLAVPGALAYPGMGTGSISGIMARYSGGPGGDSTELLGDLITLADNQLTQVGSDIKNILLGKASGSSNDYYQNVPALGTQKCAQDTCCVWKYIAADMAAAMKGDSGRCNEISRQALRLGFHDAACWTKTKPNQGGADGSILLNPAELKNPANDGFDEVVDQMNAWYKKYHPLGVSMADLIQMGATVATVTCPLGPRVRSFVGRKDSTVANDPSLLPDALDNAENLINLFLDKTISPNGLVALLGAHSTSQQETVDVSRSGDPQDSTPGVYDTLYYGQTVGSVPTPERVYKFPSDVYISQHPKTSPQWWAYAQNGAQGAWDAGFSREYVRVSLLGVNNINSLTECSKVLPAPTTSWTNPDQSNMDKWLNSIGQTDLAKKITAALKKAQSITSWSISQFFHWIW